MFDQYFGIRESRRYQVGPRYVCGRDGDVEFVDVPMRLEDAEFWSVYKQEPDELWAWLKDFPNEKEAVGFVHEALELRRMGGETAESVLLSQTYTECSGAIAA